MQTMTDLPRGLKGVVVTETTVGDVRGDQGFFHYRQYDATQLAERRTFEDVWALLVDGELPTTPGDRQASAHGAAVHRALPDGLDPLLRDVATGARGTGPLDGLRTMLSATGAALGL